MKMKTEHLGKFAVRREGEILSHMIKKPTEDMTAEKISEILFGERFPNRNMPQEIIASYESALRDLHRAGYVKTLTTGRYILPSYEIKEE